MGSGNSVPLSNRNDHSRDFNLVYERESSHQDQTLIRGLRTTDGPTDSQGPSPYATLRRDAWWQQRPSAPNLPGTSSIRGSYAGPYEENVRQQETLLAFASQMTGWQSGGGSNLGSSRSEVSELSRTVSCLAAANQQLAVAHGTALAHLEALYRDVRSARLARDNEKEFLLKEEVRDEEPRREVRRRTSRWSQGSRYEQSSATHENNERKRETREEAEEQDEWNGIEDEYEIKMKTALSRIEELENALRCERLKNMTGNTIQRTTIGNAFTNNKEVQCNDDNEIQRINTECFETQRLNGELKNDSEIQRQMIERLKEENKVSKSQREEIDRLTRELDSMKRDKMKLIEDVDSIQAERDSALIRISSLEQDLQKSIVDRDHLKNTESQKSAKLKAQLAEEVADKKKQIKALEEALEEIQRLKLVVKTDKKENSNSTNFASSTDSSPDSTLGLENADEIPEELACSRTINMDEFKKELTLKREARQRAIAAVSSEMDRLRRELGAEKEAHSETSRMLDLLKSGEPAREIRELRTTAGQAESTVDFTNEEIERLKIELAEEKEAHQETLKRITAQQIADTLKVSDEIKNFVRFEAEKLEDLRYHLERDTDKHEHQIFAVKEAVSAARLVLAARDKQVNKLKDQLAHILARLGGMNYSVIFDDARAEFDHQLENLRNLKTLYEVRLKVLIELKEYTRKELIAAKEKLEISEKQIKTLEEDLERADEKVDVQDTAISNLESQLGLTKADCRDLENQMSVINSLFTQMLLSASSADMDLDRLTRLLQENHDLISNMAREEGTEAAALPKLLLDLVEQVEGRNPTKPRTSNSDGEKNEEDIQEENIAHNLPKVWRVLLELLSCHAVDDPSTSASAMSAPDSCYKSVDTPSGPQLVISVSKTYIRLKELILEKKQLEKEMTRMKQLNTHLESKLGEQEKRLSTVSSELSKTWNIVGRMQAQHQQLHTHEKILRYELQQKRKMLQELKQELEYCKEKWESARQKNTNTELEWKNLRREFAARKALAVQDSLNNSGESGFSDERGDESDEEDEGRTERIRISPRRRTRKESPRAPSPDTESEQPTDTEISESKTCSSETLEHRTPTPETETEADVETIDVDPISDEVRPATPQPDCTPESEILDPLDRALTNVIQSLIKIDTVSNPSSASTSRESIALPSTSGPISSESSKKNMLRRNVREWSPHSEPWSSSNADIKMTTLSSKKPLKLTVTEKSFSFDSCSVASGSVNENTDADFSPRASSSMSGNLAEVFTEKTVDYTKKESVLENEELGNSTNTEEAAVLPTVSVFSIGPYPTSKSPSPVKTVQFREPLILETSHVPCALDGNDVSTFGESLAASTSGSEPKAERNEDDENLRSLESLETDVSDVKLDNNDAKIESTDLKETLNDLSASAITKKTSEVEDKFAEVHKTLEKRVDEAKKESETLAEPASASASSSSGSSSVPKPSRTPEEVLAARAARLKRLEEQADWLMKKMNATSQRGSALSSRLEELHEVYGEPPAPPPLPDVLPSVRLQTNYEENIERDRESTEGCSSTTEIPPLNEEKIRTDANESPPDNAP